jgi:hypothetical protein
MKSRKKNVDQAAVARYLSINYGRKLSKLLNDWWSKIGSDDRSKFIEDFFKHMASKIKLRKFIFLKEIKIGGEKAFQRMQTIWTSYFKEEWIVLNCNARTLVQNLSYVFVTDANLKPSK